MPRSTPTSPADYFARLCEPWASRIELAFNRSTPLEAVRDLIVGLPAGWRFEFYDRDYPSPSDPGGYVTLDRRGRRYRVRRANHGWHSGWEELTPDEAAEYAHRCRGHRDPLGPPHEVLTILVRKRPTKGVRL